MTGGEMKKVYSGLRESDNYLILAIKNGEVTFSVDLTPDQIEDVVVWLLERLNELN